MKSLKNKEIISHLIKILHILVFYINIIYSLFFDLVSLVVNDFHLFLRIARISLTLLLTFSTVDDKVASFVKFASTVFCVSTT